MFLNRKKLVSGSVKESKYGCTKTAASTPQRFSTNNNIFVPKWGVGGVNMERLFSNKKIDKARQDIKGYCISCDTACHTSCEGSCNTSCDYKCTHTCFAVCHI